MKKLMTVLFLCLLVCSSAWAGNMETVTLFDKQTNPDTSILMGADAEQKDKLPEQPKNVNRVEEALKETPLPMTEEEKMRQNLTPPTDEFIKTLAGEQNLVYTIGKEGEERFYSDDGIPIYPSNNGAVGKPEIISLKVGDKILTRYGSDRGSYVSPKGTSFEERALPRTTDKNNYHEYEVTKEITQVESAVIAPWFGQKGGGIQYKLPQRISELGDFLKEVTGDDV